MKVNKDGTITISETDLHALGGLVMRENGEAYKEEDLPVVAEFMQDLVMVGTRYTKKKEITMRIIDADDLYRKVVGYNGGAVDKTVAKRLIEQQPTVQRNSTQSNASNTLNALDTTLNALDTIYRQAAIDAECEVCQIAPKKERGHNCIYYVHGCKEIECLRVLPSAQPERQVELDGTESNIEILSELRAQFNCFDEVEEPCYRALSDAICALSAQPEPPEPEELDFVQPHKKIGVQLEVEQPEIIRCKDCKYSSPNKVYGCRIYSFADDLDERMYSNDFCSRAERRTDEDMRGEQDDSV